MNLKKIIALVVTFIFTPLATYGATPLIDNPKQIKAGVLEAAFAPTLSAIGASTAALRTDLTAETTTRIAADAALGLLISSETLARQTADAAIAVDTTSTKVLLDLVILSTGSFITIETDPVTGAITGLVKADGAGNISAAVAGVDYLVSFTETDPVVGGINGIVMADGIGGITAALAGTDYIAAETDPIAGAVNGIIKADGLGNFSAAVAGVDYLVTYTETDPVVGGINGIVLADGIGGITAALAGTDYIAAETDPIAGAVNGIIKANGLGNFSAAVSGVDYGDVELASTQTFTGENTFTKDLLVERDGSAVYMKIKAHGDSAFFTTVLEPTRSRGTTAAPTALLSGDFLWGVNVQGHDGTSYTTGGGAAGISVNAGENWSPTNRGTIMAFGSVANGSTSKVNRLVLASDGIVEIPSGSGFRIIDGAGAGQLLQSDASGNATWASIAFGDAVLADTQTFTGENTFDGNTTIMNGLLSASSVAVNGTVNIQNGGFPQIRLNDDATGEGIIHIGGITNFANVIASNMYYNFGDSTWYRSKDGGGTMMFMDNTTGTAGGDFSLYRSTPGLAGTPLSGSQLSQWFNYKADTNRLGLFTNSPSVSLDVAGTVKAVSFDMSREIVTNTCVGATTCSATCTGSRRTMGGSCSSSPITSPLESNITDTTYDCNAGASTDITARAVCAEF